MVLIREQFAILPPRRLISVNVSASINHGGGVLAWDSTRMTVLTKIEGVASFDTDLPLGLAPQTNVRTPCGARRVENLRPGDLIVTRRDGLQPVRMIWKRTISASEVAADPSLAPIVLNPRAIGPMMPQTELRLAGSHRLLMPGYRMEGMEDTDACLVRARDLIDTSDEAWVDRERRDTTYYNLVFDAHQVFAANGLPVESFLPSPALVCGLADEEREELARVLPDLGEDGADYPGPFFPVWDDEVHLLAKSA
jgi:hypothetical protein